MCRTVVIDVTPRYLKRGDDLHSCSIAVEEGGVGWGSPFKIQNHLHGLLFAVLVPGSAVKGHQHVQQWTHIPGASRCSRRQWKMFCC